MFFNKTQNEKILKILLLNSEENSIIKEELKNRTLNILSFKEYNNYINNFVSKFAENFPNYNYSFLINNLNSLDIYIYTYNIENTQGHYDEENNNIILITPENNISSKDIIDTLNHELLHLASHNGTRKQNITGFRQQTSILTNNIIGQGLNEGYTEYLNLKYFSTEKDSQYYEEERKLAQKIERIVGQNTMEKAYFDANLYIIIKKLSKYSTLDESIDIIKEMDKFSIIESDTEKISKYFEINNRLNRIIMNKENKETKVLKRC